MYVCVLICTNIGKFSLYFGEPIYVIFFLGVLGGGGGFHVCFQILKTLRSGLFWNLHLEKVLKILTKPKDFFLSLNK